MLLYIVCSTDKCRNKNGYIDMEIDIYYYYQNRSRNPKSLKI